MSKHTCPACDRFVINRRLPQCEFCGADLPADALMSPDELDADEERAERTSREARRKRSEEREARGEARKKGFWRAAQGWFGGPR